ncbi:MAG: DUF3999 domain-containing protein [Proteobacteria bacterium]|nr:DUF3999 domain-containing protein [Pseudomonadota bacterium]MBU1710417.1 DUF3999 domain-containing protein [Pseudomonadota bacterium]
MRYLLLGIFVFLSVAQAQAETFTTGDFAYGYPLTVNGNGAICSLFLPEEIYGGVTRKDLGDIRLFNAGGDIIPHTIRRQQLESSKLSATENVPLFPLYTHMQRRTNGDLSLLINRKPDGTIIQLDTTDSGEGQPDKSLYGYLLDMSRIEEHPARLELQWEDSGDHFLTTVNLHHSDDLAKWTSLSLNNTVAELNYSGDRIYRNSIPLPQKTQKYIQLTWPVGKPQIVLKSVKVISRPLQLKRQRQWTELQGIRGEDSRMVFEYISAAYLPVDAVNLSFQEKNSIIKATIKSRADEDAQWRIRARGVFYNLEFEEGEIRNEIVTINQTVDKLWRVEVSQDGAGLDLINPPPALALGWTPHELLFIARGAPPFMVAYGSGKLTHDTEAGSSTMILQALKKSKSITSSVQIGKRMRLGGEGVLEIPPPPKPWKKWILWGVLVSGVLIMIRMVWSLQKQMAKTAKGD